MKRRRWLFGALPVFVAGGALIFSPKPDLTPSGGYATAVLDRHGALMRLNLAPDDRLRLPVSLPDVAPAVVTATVLYEDRHFRTHPGINPASVLRAAWTTYVSRERAIGASTLTMQLARMHYDLETRSVRGKLVQMARALQIERHYNKDEILEAYLNHAPYGGSVEGIEAAAWVYFDKPARDLTVAEAAMLAVIPQNPTARNPSRAGSAPARDAARARLLSQWQRADDLTPEVMAQATLPLSPRPVSGLPFRAPHEVQHAASRAHQPWLRSTVDLQMQETAEKVLSRYLDTLAPLGVNNAAALILDHTDMSVRASIGSASFFDADIDGQVDGTRARRSPGSTLKPLLYAMAMDDGLIHPMSLMADAPTRYAAYAPENFDRGFLGPLSATAALNLSRNVPAIELLARVGHDRFHAMLEDARVADMQPADHYGLAMILGGNELTMRELSGLYAMLANGGRWRPLRERQTDPPTSGIDLLSPEASFLALDMLRDHRRPDGLRRAPGKVAWKTGTSYGFRDAWTVGVAGRHVVAVWVGHFDGRPNPALVGGQAAAPLFFHLLDALDLADDARPAPSRNLNLKRVNVCAPTGDLAGPHCPQTKTAWFIPGVSPIRVSTVHRAIRVHTASGRRACSSGDDTHQAVFEFWPSDIARVFAQAGVALQRAPKWHPDCDMTTRGAYGQAPKITAPAAGLEYVLRGAEDEALSLQAATDADASWLYWFVDGDLIAEGPREQLRSWAASAGEHQLIVVDDLGRSSARTVRVTRAH
ncbi:MAG: penicillin-binding protein 1C [Pseudomonadota bacterium]